MRLFLPKKQQSREIRRKKEVKTIGFKECSIVQTLLFTKNLVELHTAFLSTFMNCLND
jgi:hypothetical protein